MGKAERTDKMNEQYGIELDLILNSFDEKIEQVKKTIKGLETVKLKVDTNAVNKEAKKVKKLFNLNDVSDTSGLKINGIDNVKKQIKGISNEFKNLTGQKYGLENVIEMQKYKSKVQEATEEVKKLKQEASGVGYIKYDSNSIQKFINGYGGAKRKITGFTGEVRGLSNETSNISSLSSRIKELVGSFKISAVNGFKKAVNGIGIVSSRLGNIFSKLKNKIHNTFDKKPATNGLRDILKYAGALFGLRSIYSMLRQSASSWLSSQNVEAQQLSRNIEYLKYAMGSVLAPVIKFVTDLVYTLMKAIQSLVYSFSGVNIFAKATASSMKSTSSSAKEASKALAGFDELNNIEQKSGSSGEITPTMDLSNVDTSFQDLFSNLNFEDLGKKVGEKINSALEKIPWDKIQSTCVSIAANISDFINGAVDGINWNLVGTTIGNGLNTITKTLDAFFTKINWEKIGQSFATGANGLIDIVDWNLLGKTFADKWNVVIDTAYGFVTSFDFSKFGNSIGTSLNSAISNIHWDKAGEGLSSGIKGIFDSISGFFKTFDWSKIVDGLFTFIGSFDWGGVATSIFNALGSACASLVNLGMVLGEYIKQAFSNIGQYFNKEIEECGGNIVLGILNGIGMALIGIGKWINDNIFTPFINGFKNVFGIHSPSTVMEKMGGYIIDGLKNGLKGIWGKVKEIFSTLKSNIKETFESIKSRATSISENLVNSVKSKFNTLKSNLTNIVNNVKEGVVSKFTAIKDKVVSIFETLKKKIKSIFEGIWKNIKGVINSILGGIEGMANGVVKGINKVISAMNNLSFTIPDWVPGGMGGKKFGFSIRTMQEISIPKLDVGTNYVPEDQLAYIHKGEAVIPKKFNSDKYFGQNNSEETNYLLRELIEKIDEKEFNPYITVEDIGKASVKYQNYKSRQLGRSVLV